MSDKLIKNKFKKVNECGYQIIIDGHTMFAEDVCRKLDRLDYVESLLKSKDEEIEILKTEIDNLKAQYEFSLAAINAEKNKFEEQLAKFPSNCDDVNALFPGYCDTVMCKTCLHKMIKERVV